MKGLSKTHISIPFKFSAEFLRNAGPLSMLRVLSSSSLNVTSLPFHLWFMVRTWLNVVSLCTIVSSSLFFSLLGAFRSGGSLHVILGLDVRGIIDFPSLEIDPIGGGEIEYVSFRNSLMEWHCRGGRLSDVNIRLLFDALMVPTDVCCAKFKGAAESLCLPTNLYSWWRELLILRMILAL